MDAYAEPLDRLRDAGNYFVLSKKTRVLHVVLGSELRTLALTALVNLEHLGPNRRAFVLFEDEAAGSGWGWSERAERVRLDFERRTEAHEEAELPIGEFIPGEWDGSAFGAFGAALAAYRDGLVSPVEGLVVVLAPTRIENADSWRGFVVALLAEPRLEDIRFILVDPAEGLALQRDLLGPKTLSIECIVDEDALTEDLRALADGVAAHKTGPASAGMAWPRDQIIPVRPGLPDGFSHKTDDEQDGLDASLRHHNVMGVLALRDGDMPLATTEAREARNVAQAAGDVRATIGQEMMLASYLLMASQHSAALRRFECATELAHGIDDLAKEEATAEMSAGLVHGLLLAPDAAMSALTRAAHLAEFADEAVLAVECWRMVGQLALELDLDHEAVSAWSQALRVVGEHPGDAPHTSIVDVGHLLAGVLRRQGKMDAAAAVEHAVEKAQETKVDKGGV